MQETPILFSQNLYSKHLSMIGNIHFTAREIDVIACILSARKTSKIAYFLSINPRTVETHIRNIMSKSGANTREGIIDFIEAFPDEIFLLRKYYALLRIEAAFEKSLKDISRLNQETTLCFLLHEKDTDFLATQLKSHLKLAGITISRTSQKIEKAHVLFILSKAMSEDKTSSFLHKYRSNKILFLVQRNHQEIAEKIKNFDIIDFSKGADYYFSFFNLITKLFPILNIETVKSEFQNKFDKVSDTFQWTQNVSNVSILEKNLVSSTKFNLGKLPYSHPTRLQNTDLSESTFTSLSALKLLLHNKSRPYFLSLLCLLSFISIGFLTIKSYQSNEQQKIVIRSDLTLPKASVFLHRTELLKIIDHKLKLKDSPIPTVALVGIVGMGGVGKTTLARYYARTYQYPLVWEINAETKESLMTSFEELSLALANNKDQKEKLNSIQNIQNAEQREKELLNFIKCLLRNASNWLLIYDNVESFVEIQKYFPDDPNVWGSGKVIITTRETNIKKGETIQVDELTEREASALFCKIIVSGEYEQLTQPQKERIKEFLKYIPSFPLDISTAAYYIKNTSLTFEEYLERLEIKDKNLTEKQPAFIKENSNYIHTRYGIVASSIRKLIEINREYKELLMLMCLIDSQNIPLDFFEFYKDEKLIDQFIYDLQKYSLITNKPGRIKGKYRCFSLHRSVQTLGKKYLLTVLSKDRYQELLDQYISAVKKFYLHYLKKDYKAILPIVPHLEALVKNINDTLPDHKKKDRKTQDIFYLLTQIYSQCSRNPIYEKLYSEKVYDLQKATHYFSKHEMANFLKNLAYTCMSMENHNDAKKYANKSLELCKQIPNALILMADNYTIIADAYTHQNNFNLAHHTLEKALEVIKPIDANQRKEAEACILAFMGRLYSETYIAGERAEKGAQYIADSLKMIDGSELLFKRKEKPKTKISGFISRHKVIYGIVLCRLGRYQDALDCFDDSKFIVDNDLDNCPHTFSNNMCQMRRGEIALRNGKIKEAEKLLNESITNLQRLVAQSNTFVFIPNVLSTEVLIRSNKLDKAYQQCLLTLSVGKTSNTNYSNLMFSTLHYHAAIIQYRLRNYKKSLEHLHEFIKLLKPLCYSILEQARFEMLAKSKPFDLPDNDTPLSIAIKYCFQASQDIFQAIYGVDHPFIKDYIALNNEQVKNSKF